MQDPTMSLSTFPVEITPEAITQMRAILERKGHAGDFVRIGVKGGGCSGFEYVIRFESTARESDLVWTDGDLKVLLDPKSAEFLAGSKLIWTGNLLGGGFGFENPNASRSCGCGVSFTPKSL